VMMDAVEVAVDRSSRRSSCSSEADGFASPLSEKRKGKAKVDPVTSGRRSSSDASMLTPTSAGGRRISSASNSSHDAKRHPVFRLRIHGEMVSMQCLTLDSQVLAWVRSVILCDRALACTGCRRVLRDKHPQAAVEKMAAGQGGRPAILHGAGEAARLAIAQRVHAASR
jgi:hypothetical protein